MKCICRSDANETIEDLTTDCQTLNERVIALRNLWGESIKANEVLKTNIRVLTEFNFSLHPLPLTRSPGDHE